MKRLLFCLLAVLIFSCERSSQDPDTPEPRKTDLPEQLESEAADIASRGWDSLAGRVKYFYNEFILNGKTEGYDSDSVYYALRGSCECDTAFLTFTVQDSVLIKAKGWGFPLNLGIHACKTDIGVTPVNDSIRVDMENISATAPKLMLLEDNPTVSLGYCGKTVGYIDFIEFENTDYTIVEDCPVVHYFDDRRTFGFYETLNIATVIDLIRTFVMRLREEDN